MTIYHTIHQLRLFTKSFLPIFLRDGWIVSLANWSPCFVWKMTDKMWPKKFTNSTVCIWCRNTKPDITSNTTKNPHRHNISRLDIHQRKTKNVTINSNKHLIVWTVVHVQVRLLLIKASLTLRHYIDHRCKQQSMLDFFAVNMSTYIWNIPDTKQMTDLMWFEGQYRWQHDSKTVSLC